MQKTFSLGVLYAMKSVTFNGALEAVESLSIDDQAALLEIIQRRLIEHRQTEIASNIVQAKSRSSVR